MQQQGTELAQLAISSLEGTDCSFCADGELTQDTYKGNDAVVCDACDTPGAQFW
ncbi:HVO_A0556 family zinc finger protein [Natrinema sp. H-ect4]|uniref:HVO_A0556 family zinc finger protein n=1 Tax=Natrinema sp. H-ect4 TaxID=3242699 RepID=UPI0035A8533A